MPPQKNLKAVIVGCGTIGMRSHVKCFSRISDVDLVAISRTTPDGSKATTQKIQETYGVKVLPFSDVSEMISETQPDIVVISSPAEAHYENARDVLEAGRSLSGILVEKPLVYYPKKTPVTSTSDACHLSRICLDRKVLLDTTVQLRILAQDYFKHFPPQGCNKLVVEWDCSKEDAIERWRDIGPHVVAMIEEKYPLAEIWAPQKRVVDGDFVINGNAHLASGGIIGSTEGLLPVSITIGARGKAQRRFGYEGNVCQVAYDKDRDEIGRAHV